MSETRRPAENPSREIFQAVKRGDVATVRALLETNPQLVEVRAADGSTPLHFAAWKGRAEVATALLAAGADVNAQSENGHWGGTPLHAAAHGKQRAVAEVLIAHGAVVHARSCNGRTPMEETTIHNATAVAKLLTQHGVKSV